MHPAEPLLILTNRVALRRLAPGDLPAFQAYRNDPEVGRYQGWLPMSDAEAAGFLVDVSVGRLLEPGVWSQIAIADAGSRALLGDIGLCVAADSSEAEIGFTVSPAAQGRGIATEAVTAAIDWLFTATPIHRVLGITDARNARSIRMLRRVGLQRVSSHVTVFRGERCIEEVYELLRAGAA